MDNILAGLCGRMCRAPCPRMMGRTSGGSLPASSTSKHPRQMFLCLRMENGSEPERFWEIITLSRGASSMPRRVGESHKDGGVFLLSSILMVNVPERYSLSQKACLGILRRAEKRGKELPDVLRRALERQAGI